MSTDYPSSWPHTTTQVIGDTIRTSARPTAKPSHARAPGHGLVSVHSSVKLRQHTHVARCLTQALIARP